MTGKIVHTFAFGTVCHSLTVWNGWLMAATSDGIWIQRHPDGPFERYADIEPYLPVKRTTLEDRLNDVVDLIDGA